MSDEHEILDTQRALTGAGLSAAAKYQALAVGRPGVGALLSYELMQMVSGVPGAAGWVLRRWAYRRALGSSGKDVAFGVHAVLRHPHKIRLGNHVVVDDFCLLDAKGETNRGIDIGSAVVIGRGTALHCKNGDIVVGDGVNVGYGCQIASSGRVTIGDKVLIAAYAYIIGGGHQFDRPDVAVIDQRHTAKGIEIGAGAWIGAGVLVMDGVRIGEGAIVGAGSVVTRDIPDGCVAVGSPARVVRQRDGTPAPAEG